MQQARRKVGLRQDDAVEATGRDTRTIQRYESGKQKPGYDDLRKLMTLYGCEASDLIMPFDGTDEE